MKETLDEQSRRDLVKYRIDRAYETLKEVDLLADNGFIQRKIWKEREKSLSLLR